MENFIFQFNKSSFNCRGIFFLWKVVYSFICYLTTSFLIFIFLLKLLHCIKLIIKEKWIGIQNSRRKMRAVHQIFIFPKVLLFVAPLQMKDINSTDDIWYIYFQVKEKLCNNFRLKVWKTIIWWKITEKNGNFSNFIRH